MLTDWVVVVLLELASLLSFTIFYEIMARSARNLDQLRNRFPCFQKLGDCFDGPMLLDIVRADLKDQVFDLSGSLWRDLGGDLI